MDNNLSMHYFIHFFLPYLHKKLTNILKLLICLSDQFHTHNSQNSFIHIKYSNIILSIEIYKKSYILSIVMYKKNKCGLMDSS